MAVFLGGCSALLTGAAAEEPTSVLAERQSCAFADRDTVVHVSLPRDKAADQAYYWAYTAADKRVISRGQLTVEGANARFGIARIHTPTVNPGVVLKTTLSLSNGQSQPVADGQRTLWIFPEDPFDSLRESLKQAGIVLYDPAGATAKGFTDLKVPFEPVYNVAAIAELKPGVLVIGERLALADEAGLADVILSSAQRGWAVVCLAPKSGTVQLPLQPREESSSAASVAFRRSEAITELDKRLDSLTWSADNRLVASTLAIKTEGEQVIGEFSAEAAGWPWADVRYSAEKGRLIYCGFGVVEHWSSGPSPRYFLARLFESLIQDRIDPTSQEKESRP